MPVGRASLINLISSFVASNETKLINDLKQKITKIDVSSSDRTKIIQSVVQAQIKELKATNSVTAETGKKLLEAIKTSQDQISEELLVKLEGIIATQLPFDMDIHQADRLLHAFENNLRTCSEFSEIEGLQQQLTRIGMFIQAHNKDVPKSTHLLFLKRCDSFSLRLLDAHKHLEDASTHPFNLNEDGKSPSYKDLKIPDQSLLPLSLISGKNV